MNRISLSDASFEALLRLADTYGADVPSDATREELEELVSEAIEEWEQEHKQTNNHSVRIEETKYDVQAEGGTSYGETGEDDLGEDAELPASYNETRIVLMLRDPAWAFAYWDLREADVAEFQRSSTFDGLVLRVFAMSQPDAPIASIEENSDIPVTLMDSSWYIYLPEQELHYRIALVARHREGERVLAVSNVVAVPRGAVAETVTRNGDSIDEILAQTGIQDLDVPAEGKQIPQRILDLIDEELLFR
jgi:hypothetical protein